MGEEMHRQAIWRKAIPHTRDRMQSQSLVGFAGSLLVALTVWTILLSFPMTEHFPLFILGVVGISVAFAGVVWVLRAATAAGAVCGGMICLLLMYWTGAAVESPARTAVTPLALLFALTFLSTRAGKQRKVKAGLAEGKKGRSASQVIANLGFSALCVTPWMATVIGWSTSSTSQIPALALDWTLKVMCLAALAEAAADTVSSEIGQAFGGVPVILHYLDHRQMVGWRRVEPGTDGAVTMLGTVAGVIAGCLVAAAGMGAMHLGAREALVAAGAGSLGLFFDSLLGATVERRGWLGNDLVNFSSTVFAGVAAAMMYRLLAS
ncbi:MAG: protein of unknown function transrane [Acidobacteriaceae bacterium]|nr:protein of unknown function transrane [Acidobacteriaceae bacterium]